MSKKASPALIGSFVLGGAALLVVFVLIIVGDSFFKAERRYVIYFEGTIFGLKTGSNVMFRGVPIGYVSDIDVLADFEDMEFFVPVTVTINPDSIKLLGPDKGLRSQDEADVERLVDMGLRASLASESLITGQLYIEMDFFPDTDVVYRGNDEDYPEIPSVPSGIQEVIANAQVFVAEIQNNLDIPKVMGDLTNAIEGIEKIINSDSTQNLTTELSTTLVAVRASLESVDRVADSLDSVVVDVGDDIVPAVTAFSDALVRAESVLALAETQLRDDSDIAYRVGTTLKEVEAAARAIRILAEELEQEPEALIQGKQ